MSIVIRALTKNDKKDNFDSGNVELDQFFKKYASQNKFKNYIGSTYVGVIDDMIVGYVTLSASSIKINEYEKLQQKLPGYPLPVLRISRLAVDKKYQNNGIGKELLKFALNLSIEQKNMFGCIGLVVDAKDEAVSFYEQYGFETIDIISGDIDTRPFAKMMFLSMNSILKC